MIEIQSGTIKKHKIEISSINLNLPDNGLFSLEIEDAFKRNTLIDLVLGNIYLKEGTYNYKGVSINKKNVSIIKNDATIVDENCLITDFNIIQNVLLFAKTYDKEKLLKCLANVHVQYDNESIDEFLNKNIILYSEEIQIKIALALKLYFGYKTIIYKREFLNDELINIIDQLSADNLMIVINDKIKNLKNDNVKHITDLDYVCESQSVSEVISEKQNKKLSLSLVSKKILSIFNTNKKKILASVLLTSLSAGIVSSIISYRDDDFVTRQINNCDNEKLQFITLDNMISGFDHQMHYRYSGTDFDSETIDKIKTHFDNNVYHYTNFDIDRQYINKSYKYDDLVYDFKAVEFDESLGLKTDTRIKDTTICKNPKTNDEIGISRLLAESMLGDNQEISSKKIETIDDLIGCKINGKTIVNIYETEESKFIKNNYAALNESIDKEHISSFYLSRCVFIGGTLSEPYYRNNSLIVKLTENKNEDIRFIKSLNKQILGLGTRVDVNSVIGGFMDYNNFISWSNIPSLILPFILLLTFIGYIVYFNPRLLKHSKDESYYNSVVLYNNGIDKIKTNSIRLIPFSILVLTELAISTLISYSILAIINAIWSSAFYTFMITPLSVVIGLLMIVILNIIPHNNKK